MDEVVLAWAACPICDLTVSEAVPRVEAEEDWQTYLSDAVQNGLIYFIERHKRDHDIQTIRRGFSNA